MIQYLLGELSEAERAQLEELIFREPQYFAQLQQLEELLIDDYVCDALPAEQRQKFETGYLITARRRQKLRLAQELKQTLATVPAAPTGEATKEHKSFRFTFWPQPSGLGKHWGRWGLACGALILLLAGSWFIFRASRTVALMPGVAALPSPTLPSPPSLPAPASSPTAEPSKAAVAPTAPRAVTLVSVLSPSLWRTDEPGETTNTILLNPQVATLALQLKYKINPPYRAYRVTIETVAGATVLRRDQVQPDTQKPLLSVQIPAQTLTTDDYVLNLFGQNDRGEYEELDEYSFRIIKK